MMKQLGRLASTFIVCFSLGAAAKSMRSDTQSASKGISSQSLLVELTGQDVTKEDDLTMYSQMVNSFQKDDEIGLKSRLQSLLQRFPQSIYSDNALYLAGRMAVDHKDYAEAIKFFSQIERDYPKSNKVTAAKFAKAMTYKAMNLPELSTQVLNEVRSNYVGSPESFRANAELKIIQKEL
jgi:TolA-binding protein